MIYHDLQRKTLSQQPNMTILFLQTLLKEKQKIKRESINCKQKEKGKIWGIWRKAWDMLLRMLIVPCLSAKGESTCKYTSSWNNLQNYYIMSIYPNLPQKKPWWIKFPERFCAFVPFSRDIEVSSGLLPENQN